MKKTFELFGVIVLVTIIGFTIAACGGNEDPKTVVTLSPTTLTLEVNQAERIIATTDPANATLTWTSSDTAVATVGADGWVTGVSEGNATITATATDGGKATCAVTVEAATSNYTVVEGETLVHYLPQLRGVSDFGSDLGTNNSDGSYTFAGTGDAWSGGGARYTFPTPGASATWKLADYQVVEMHLIVTDGSVTAAAKKFGGNLDLKPYPTDGSNSIAFNAATNGGKFTYKAVIGEAGSGIGFQRNTGGPATVAIEKVVFSKVAVHTITFNGGEYTAMPAIAPVKIPTGRTVNFGGSYVIPLTLTWADHSFTGWKNGAVDFNLSTPITSDITLTAQWVVGGLVPVDMKLNLNPATWPNPLPANAAAQSGSPAWTWPANYASTAYNTTTGVLAFTFSGDNRQRAIIPLSTEQVNALMTTQEAGVTFRIVGTVKKQDGTNSTAEFRCHLGNPTPTSGWNGTETGEQTALANHLVEYRPFDSSNKSQANLSWFMIQAMYKGSNATDSVQSGHDPVVITIESITIDVGDTSSM